MTDQLRQAAQAVLDRWDSPAWEWVMHGPTADLMAALRTALEQSEQEPWGWVGLTDEDWGWVADRKGTSLDSFDQGAAWAQARLQERNT